MHFFIAQAISARVAVGGGLTSKFLEFLTRNTIRSDVPLPLVHTTQAYHIAEIQSQGIIRASPCDVFQDEKLNYFFVGRPAYKKVAGPTAAEYWQLPLCFIFKFEALTPFKRVFPFDSGAFHKGLFPPYISLMNKEPFECGAVNDAPSKIIGAFFGSSASYYGLNGKAKDKFEGEFSLGVLDAQVRALHKLSLDDTSPNIDDRRLTIEVQTDRDVDLALTTPMAVVAPSVYFDDPQVLDIIENTWKAQPIGYDVHPLNGMTYYATIYSLVRDYYRTIGLLV